MAPENRSESRWTVAAGDTAPVGRPAAYVVAGGSVHDAAQLISIRPSLVNVTSQTSESGSGMTTEQLI